MCPGRIVMRLVRCRLCLVMVFMMVLCYPTFGFRMTMMIPSSSSSFSSYVGSMRASMAIRRLYMMEEDTNTNDDTTIASLLSQNNYAAAFDSIKSNPLTRVSFDQAIIMLNHLGKCYEYQDLTIFNKNTHYICFLLSR